jgi:hypothetical protein
MAHDAAQCSQQRFSFSNFSVSFSISQIQSRWCKNKNSKTLFHCSTRDTSALALVLFHLLNSWSRQLFHALSDVTHTDATLALARLLSAAHS